MDPPNQNEPPPLALVSIGLAEAHGPLPLFSAWLEEATSTEISDANAMTLATLGVDGIPNARIVLLKAVDPRGFVFYTNTHSTKGLELADCPKAALVFHWKSLQRQVRVRGLIEPTSDAEADEYFATRPRDSQIGAWASAQSTPLSDRATFETQLLAFSERFPGAVPRPPHWRGFRVLPGHIEFWQARPFRLHDRIAFSRSGLSAPWQAIGLYP